MKTRQSLSIIAVSILWASVAHAQSVVQPTLGPQLQPQQQLSGANASAQQQAQSQAASFGTLNMTGSPADTNSKVFVAPSTALGSYAAGFSPYNCYGTTKQGAVSTIFGSISAGGGGGLNDCQLGWLQNDYARQAAVIDAADPIEQARSIQISVNLRCMVSSDAYDAIMAEYTDGKRSCHVKPRDYSPTQDKMRNTDGTQQYVKAETH